MRILLSVAMICLAALQACGAGGQKSASADSEEKFPDGEIEFPSVPSSITEPAERAAYVIMHFWDPMDFTEHQYSLDTTFMELNFANYAQFYPFVSDSVAQRGVEVMLDKAAADAQALKLLAKVGEKYLGERESPMYHETAYMALLEGVIQRNGFSTSEALRAKYRLEQLKKNRPGMAAADFRFQLRDGRETSLYASSRAPYTLLLFYNPDCDTCHEMILKVQQNKDVTALVDRGVVAVVAIYAEGDREAWDKSKDNLPAKWLVGYDLSDILDNEIYVYDYPPSIYLLDANKRVIFKEPTLEQLEDYARSH